MKFSEKIKNLRINHNLTQKELALSINVTLRTIANYEMGVSYPKKRDIYYKLAEVLNVDINYLLTEDEEFILKANDTYGQKGANEAKKLVSQISLLFSNGKLSDEDKDEMMKSLQDAYWLSKNKK